MSASQADVRPNPASRSPAVSMIVAPAAPAWAMSRRILASNSANIGASYTTPSSRPSLSRPNAPPGGSG